jgi:hypothetical protein
MEICYYFQHGLAAQLNLLRCALLHCSTLRTACMHAAEDNPATAANWVFFQPAAPRGRLLLSLVAADAIADVCPNGCASGIPLAAQPQATASAADLNTCCGSWLWLLVLLLTSRPHLQDVPLLSCPVSFCHIQGVQDLKDTGRHQHRQHAAISVALCPASCIQLQVV